MPRGDGTGPLGQGPMTGRALGYCAGFATPGFANTARGAGRGMAWGRGGGIGLGLAYRRGRGRGQALPAEPIDEVTVLQERLAALESNAAQIKQRLNEIQGR